MKIKVKRDGGFVPLPIAKEANSEDLEENLQKTAKNIFENADNYKLPQSKNIRDGYNYSLEISEDKKKVKLQFDEMNLPDEVRPLVKKVLE